MGERLIGDAPALNAHSDINTIGGPLDAGSAMILKVGCDLNVTGTIQLSTSNVWIACRESPD
ncbi:MULTISPECIES: hypothetical protein [Paraburkholderia]|uniref:hypothetical protein n=1 Tax=Paraburkholderia TaxID=1822464 RepID=UPI001160D67A|nr:MULTISPECIES: hypothetical protein [Paraburkholderia]MCX4164088.1 hypothetical protein [Paraburkholderia megapolitana]MDN7159583.1 hypothetical protein [Paraburkholderia sp. CHISQ3]MDQ6496630.1 hypothetical protein [Paraburkholderia megapolitana]QDQ80786.1 hypothetical protein FNZ07_06145 [Paraburkholderia megapolitana]